MGSPDIAPYVSISPPSAKHLAKSSADLPPTALIASLIFAPENHNVVFKLATTTYVYIAFS